MRTYVHIGPTQECQFAVSLRNVNLRSRLECQFALTPRQDIRYVHYTTTSGRRFLAMEDGEDSATGSSTTYVFAEPSA